MPFIMPEAIPFCTVYIDVRDLEDFALHVMAMLNRNVLPTALTTPPGTTTRTHWMRVNIPLTARRPD